ncbi:SGNH/GDSL hydrolase family protein [Deminuibacter soli]|uniref:SGNH/GDSL hydrolase family protein n=1 Tax=Deminuibacter soli TaxID=2291815 RepID=A0A3E1NLL9_9BACT|nr:SGNH/GDSL hydrolase family protein [Deminuibacter soli]RFM28825.1 SGNH/GDSL hydrolase family protein [Deminuibacter soli]
MTRHYFSFLALGDSYTIGENEPLYDSFPYQLVQLLRAKGWHIHAPEIVARTGWTTGELAAHLLHTHLADHYDMVTLLAGVNNQYRGLSLEDYKADFEFLLKKALHYSGEKPKHVFVLSIPDWSATPHAEGSDIVKVAAEIDSFNRVNAELAAQYHVHYLDITPGTRKVDEDLSLVSSDGLHLSGKIYADWAQKLAGILFELDSLKG